MLMGDKQSIALMHKCTLEEPPLATPLGTGIVPSDRRL
jgi:hypothetical protein